MRHSLQSDPMETGIEPGFLIAALYVSAGIALTGIVQGVTMITTVNRRSVHFWLYAALCLLIAAFQIEVAGYHTATTLAAAITAEKWLNAMVFVFLPLLFAFVASYTKQPHIKPWLIGLVIVCAALMLANFMMPMGIRFSQASSSLFQLPWGERLQLLHGKPSSLNMPTYLLFSAVFIWGLYRVATLFRSGERLSAVFMSSGFLAMFAGAIATRMVDMGVFNFIYLGGFGFLGFVAFMAVLVSNRLRNASKRIEQLAFNDPLTGLPNRLALLSRLNLALTRAKPVKGRVAVLIINVNHFDVINDTLGHEVGDALLLQVSQRLQQQVRDGDTVARLGGDEFAAVIGELSFTYGAGLLAEKSSMPCTFRSTWTATPSTS